MAPSPFDVLSTDRLVLRRLRDEDAPALCAYRSDPEVARFQGWGASFGEMQARSLIEAMREREPGEEGWFQFAVAECASGVLIGDLGLCAFGERQAEIGFTLARAAQGRGYAREAVSALLSYAFGPLHLHRVVAGIDPRNTKARALLERLKFRLEGRFVESFLEGNVWLDEDRFALLSREWTA
ncbi:GNAT family N-acetyltransferase [Deinococcus yavapaiensis]|uniref:RimJ/RimL family protein N-acetyltransferase n=1 Tax=Deinococcus yavapaiensis KR-236 TaxID=694435 RepID=A0A318SCH2_9DEIO|nr:GNAT family protein [Deinococcus yavapaiensis]PYE54118.1 RimJ/RimL family protein N-acetyltransferase [Deinococcus yavapaiensis KR-236]